MANPHTPRVSSILNEIKLLTVEEIVALRDALIDEFGDLPPGSGVREPRNPRAPLGESGVALALPEETDEETETGPGTWTE